MTTHFSVIQPDGKPRIAIQIIIDPTDEAQIKALIKTIRELASMDIQKSIPEGDVPPSEPVTPTDQKPSAT